MTQVDPTSDATTAHPTTEPTRAWTPSRRAVLAAVAGVGALGLAGTAAVSAGNRRPRSIELYSQTVAFTAPGEREVVADAAELVPGVRVVAGVPNEAGLAQDQLDWLGSLASWTADAGSHGELLRGALLDVYTLTEGLPATVAAWTPYWRFIWPRDTAHVAVALAAAGDLPRALKCLTFLRDAARPTGWYEARYTVDGTGAPDARAPQLDGTGWVLWAFGAVARQLDPAPRAQLWDEYGEWATGLVGLLAGLLRRDRQRLPASPDYWERRETALTLGTAAPCLAGLRALQRLGEPPDPTPMTSSADLVTSTTLAAAAATAGDTGDRLEMQIVRDFGPRGYQRYPNGGGYDAAVAMLLPPYQDTFIEYQRAVDALARARRLMARPAGGLAPGARWHDDGISWTPQTSMFAMSSAFRGHPSADAELAWLAEHRTEAGSLPEKVLEDGTPAAVAPLAWTAANVIMAIGAQHG